MDPLSLAVILASDSFALVPTSKVKALPLPVSHMYSLSGRYLFSFKKILARYLKTTIVDSAFKSGTFIDSLSFVSQSNEPKIRISVRPIFHTYLQAAI